MAAQTPPNSAASTPIVSQQDPPCLRGRGADVRGISGSHRPLATASVEDEITPEPPVKWISSSCQSPADTADSWGMSPGEGPPRDTTLRSEWMNKSKENPLHHVRRNTDAAPPLPQPSPEQSG